MASKVDIKSLWKKFEVGSRWKIHHEHLGGDCRFDAYMEEVVVHKSRKVRRQWSDETWEVVFAHAGEGPNGGSLYSSIDNSGYEDLSVIEDESGIVFVANGSSHTRTTYTRVGQA